MDTRGAKRLRALPPKGALIDAAKSGDNALVTSLLDAGTDIQEVQVDDEVRGNGGTIRTYIYALIDASSDDTMPMLIPYTADVYRRFH